MNKRKGSISRWYRVRVHATNEEKIFDSRNDAIIWADLVCRTFDDPTLLFDIIEVIEITEILQK